MQQSGRPKLNRFAGIIFSVAALTFLAGPAAFAGEDAPPVEPQKPDKRAFGVLPNYKTVEPGTVVEPLHVKQKFRISEKDSLDYPIFLVSGAVSGLAHLGNQNPSFGQGAKGYAKRFATGYADQGLGNAFVEGIFPVVLRQDIRFYRKGSGSALSRTAYAASRVIFTRSDCGRPQFNYSEFLGNAAAAAAGNLYYHDDRHLGNNAWRFGTFVATDALGNVLKEFWPDIKQKLQRHH